jgi:1,4-dihydroxy-2-naphthoate octaprenyltransferase
MRSLKSANRISASIAGGPDPRKRAGNVFLVKLNYWLLAIRPRTLSISVIPVFVGCSLAWAHLGLLNIPVLIATVLTAMLIQIGTNLHNDVADFERGTDDPLTRFGPPRATSQGWLPASRVRRAAYSSFLLAFLIGCYLVWQGGWPILVLGVLSIAAGLAYTGGPKPLAYIGLGELFVWLFFGVVAVSGSYFLQAGRFNFSAVLAGTIVGLPAAGVLVVNNYRDLESDRAVAKNTLAVRFGRHFSRIEYALLMLVPFVLLASFQATEQMADWIWLPLFVMPWALILVWKFWTWTPGPGFNRLLAGTAVFQLVFGLALGLSVMIPAKF